MRKAGQIGFKAGQQIKKGFELGIKGASKLQQKLGGIRGAILGLGVGAGISKAFGDASNVESLTTRVRLLGEEFAQLAGIERIAAQSAEKLQLANSQVLKSYIDLGNRLGEQNATAADLQNIYEGLNTVLIKNRVTTQEAASATLQLNQALGAGRLQGEEFRAVNEAAPQVISEVAKVLGVARGEVKKLASEGKVSSRVLIQALTNIRKKGAASLEEGFTGAFGATRRFNKALQEFSETIGEKLLPVITPIIEGLTNLLTRFSELDPEVQKAILGIGALVAAILVLGPPLITVVKGLVGLAAVAGTLKLGAAAAGVTKLALAFAGLKLALLALPWVALAAGVTALGVAIFKNIQKQRQYNRLVSDAPVAIQDWDNNLRELEGAIKSKSSELDRAIEKYEKYTKKAIRSKEKQDALLKTIAKLQFELNKLQGTYDVKIRVFTSFTSTARGGAEGSAAFNQKLANTKAELEKRGFTLDANGKVVPLEKGGGGGGGGGKSKGSERKSRVPELNREKELQLALMSLNKQQLDAQLAENSALVETLEKKKLVLQADKDIADIMASEVPDAEKLLERDIRRAQLQRDLDGLENQRQERLKDEVQTIKDAVAPLQKQRRLLDAQLQGREKEQVILEEIESIMKGLPEKEKKRVEELVRGNAARQEALEKLRKEQEFQRQIIDRVGRAIEDSLITTLDVAINKTKDLGEALQQIASTLLLDLGRSFLQAGIGGIKKDLFPKLYAEGGYVTGPTPALIGEGGEPEYVLPESRMSEALSRYANGARGDAVISGGASSGAYAGSGNNGSTIVNYNGPTLNFNGDDYVPSSAVPGIIDAAAAKGAKAGELRTFSALRNNRSSRARIGI